jgi:beta-1,4-N-acetylglucosaminyltransferase
MIFVSVGTNEAPFDRLVRAVGELADREECVVQYGSSSERLDGVRAYDFLPFESLVELVREARIFVTHAGAGSIIVALSEGKRPIVVPRLRRHGEAVDDHQVTFARRLSAHNLVELVEDPTELATAVNRRLPDAGGVPPGKPGLPEKLSEYITAIAGTRQPADRRRRTESKVSALQSEQRGTYPGAAAGE